MVLFPWLNHEEDLGSQELRVCPVINVHRSSSSPVESINQWFGQYDEGLTCRTSNNVPKATFVMGGSLHLSGPLLQEPHMDISSLKELFHTDLIETQLT